MGCFNSSCCKQDNLEVNLHRRQKSFGEMNLMRPQDKAKEQPAIFMKNYVEELPKLDGLNLVKETVATNDTIKKVKRMDSQPQDYSTNQSEFQWEKLLDLQLRIGKTPEELSSEYDEILNTWKTARQNISHTQRGSSIRKSRDEKISKTLQLWKDIVYSNICEKTGEIKNMITVSSNGQQFTFAHEIDGWKDVSILKKYCQRTNLNIDEDIFDIYSEKIEAVGSLTVVVWIEINDQESDLGINIGCTVSKPTDKRTLRRFLDGSCEKENILTWFNANGPMPIDYGFSLNPSDNELINGFYFFDGPTYQNLSKSLSAFQAYGADINEQNIEVFRGIPGEELKVFFGANNEGVQRVRLIMNKLPKEIEDQILGKIDNRANLAFWNEFKQSFEELTIKNYYQLEFTSEGFHLFMTKEVGPEIETNAYLDD